MTAGRSSALSNNDLPVEEIIEHERAKEYKKANKRPKSTYMHNTQTRISRMIQ